MKLIACVLSPARLSSLVPALVAVVVSQPVEGEGREKGIKDGDLSSCLGSSSPEIYEPFLVARVP